MNDSTELENLKKQVNELMDAQREKEIRADERSKIRGQIIAFLKVRVPPLVVVLGTKLIEKMF